MFSDDDGGIAAVFMEYEQQDTVTHIRKRNHQTQVLFKNDTSASAPAALTDLQPGAVDELFFMRQEGYLILRRITDQVETEDGSTEQDIWIDRIATDGRVENLGGGTFLTMLSCDGGTSSTSVSAPIRVVPNPSGTVLVRFEAETTCSERTETIQFLDAETFAEMGEPSVIPAAVDTSGFGFGSWLPVEIAWLDDERLAVGHWGMGPMDHYLATVYHLDGSTDLEEEVHMSCFYPPTTSSSVSASGQRVEIDEDSGTLSYASVEDLPGADIHTEPSFGCDE